jgi:hypothetical protein
MTGLRHLAAAVRAPALVTVLAAGLLALAACSRPDSPEAELRAVIATAKEAAEARDASALFDLIAPDYRDAQGYGADELKRYIRGWLIAHQSVRLLTRVNSLEFPAEDLAQAQVTVAMLGREADAENAWDLAADVYEFDLTLAREGGDWRVTRAAWRRAGTR